MKNNQKGFGILELLVLIILVTIIIVMGWMIYNKDKSSDSATENDSHNSEVQKTENDSEAKTEAETDIETIKETEFFEIKEMGVKFKITPKLEGLYYHTSEDGDTVYFSVEALKGTDCAAEKVAQFALSRYSEAEIDNVPGSEYIKSSSKVINGYYYDTARGQAMCTEDPKTAKIVSEFYEEIIVLVPEELQAI